jgi:hypothetical protein
MARGFMYCEEAGSVVGIHSGGRQSHWKNDFADDAETAGYGSAATLGHAGLE